MACRRAEQHPWVRRTLLHLLVGAGLLLLATAAAAAPPALRVDTPFAPQLCDAAIAAARAALAAAPRTSDRQLLAEGYLCRAAHGDAWAAPRAARLLHAVLAAEPDNFFAQLQLADAIRLRFPASPEAQQTLQRAGQLLSHSDVGDARAALAAYIAENLAAVAELRARRRASEPVVAALRGGAPSALERGEAVGWLTQSGRRESLEAARALRRHLDRRPDDAAARLQEAEALRGLAPVATVRRRYASVLRACRAAAVPPAHRAACDAAAWRLAEIARWHPRAPTSPPPAEIPVRQADDTASKRHAFLRHAFLRR